MAAYASSSLNGDPNQPIEMFGLPPLVRYLYQFGHCLDDDQKKSLLAGLTGKQRLLAHGTLNHAAMQATSWYLLAQYFPNARWTDWDGRTQYSSQKLMELLKQKLMERHRRFMLSGHVEMLSPTYAIVNIFPMLNLWDFAKDPEVKNMGGDQAALEVAILKVHSFHGIVVPPLTRKNFDQRNGGGPTDGYTPSVSQHVLWYYFGEPEGISRYELKSNREPYYVSMLALSKWTPPKELYDWDEKLQAGYIVNTVTPDFSEWGAQAQPAVFGSAFISDAYAIGTGNAAFNPDGYSEHIQTFAIALKSKEAFNQIECFHPYFNSDDGEDSWGTDRWSPFQQSTLFDKAHAGIVFNIPAKDPWTFGADNRHFMKRQRHKDGLLQTFTCRFPSGLDDIDADKDVIYLKEGRTRVAMQSLGGDFGKIDRRGPYSYVKIRSSRGAVVFTVDSGNMSRAAFKDKVRSERFDFDAERVALTFSAESAGNANAKKQKRGPEMAFRLNKMGAGTRISSTPITSGTESTLQDGMVLSSPVMTLGKGRMRIQGAGTVFERSAP